MAVATKRIRKPEVPKSGNPHQLLPRNGGFLTASDTGSPNQFISFFPRCYTHTHTVYIYICIYIYIVLKSCLINSSPDFSACQSFFPVLLVSIIIYRFTMVAAAAAAAFAVSSTMTGLFPPSLWQLSSTLVTKRYQLVAYICTHRDMYNMVDIHIIYCRYTHTHIYIYMCVCEYYIYIYTRILCACACIL